jgi:hypothetical protein
MVSKFKSLAFAITAFTLTLSGLGSAHAWQRFNPVNNPVEARRDINNNGVVGPYDRAVLANRHLYHAVTAGPRVNTPVENRYDLNNNGWIGPRERYAINHRGVSNLRDVVCDRNHNGLIGPGETRCAY